LSGGQKKLIMLAKLVVQKPRLLLLDEPDNHLDLASKQRLEELVRRYDGCVVIISHDRYLLDGIATHIAELENGRLTATPTTQPAQVNINIQGLSALVYGALPVAAAAYRGWITSLTNESRTRLNAWFPEMILYNTNHF